MNSNVFQGKWKQLIGAARKRWGKLTGSRQNAIRGDRDVMLGWMQEKYGYARAKTGRRASQVTRRFK